VSTSSAISIGALAGLTTVMMVLVGILVAALAGFVSLDTLADLTNIGTLFAFMLVSIAFLILRRPP
jgi:amino acid transporter